MALSRALPIAFVRFDKYRVLATTMRDPPKKRGRTGVMLETQTAPRGSMDDWPARSSATTSKAPGSGSWDDPYRVETFTLPDGRRAFERPDTGAVVVIRDDGMLEVR
jgi:hypothetical protein